MGEFVVKNCTRPADRHKIDFLKIYKVPFSKLKHARDPPEHAQIIPEWSPEAPKIDPQTAKNDQRSNHVDKFLLYEPILHIIILKNVVLSSIYFFILQYCFDKLEW